MIASLPASHPTLGVPSKVHSYRNESGDIVAAVYRFEPVNTGNTGGNRKQIRPYCLQSENWSRPEKPVLYDLEAIAADWSSPVILVEGEKCADALSRFGFLVTTSMGGSNAAHHTDWSPLKGRDVIIWPDHDEAGEKYADKVAALCAQAGASTIALIPVKAQTVQQSLKSAIGHSKALMSAQSARGTAINTPILTNSALPKGWDVADAIAEGWQRQQLEALIALALPYEHQSPPVATNDNWPEPDMSLLDIEVPPPVFP